jgi:hypothetical protein
MQKLKNVCISSAKIFKKYKNLAFRSKKDLKTQKLCQYVPPPPRDSLIEMPKYIFEEKAIYFVGRYILIWNHTFTLFSEVIPTCLIEIPKYIFKEKATYIVGKYILIWNHVFTLLLEVIPTCLIEIPKYICI